MFLLIDQKIKMENPKEVLSPREPPLKKTKTLPYGEFKIHFTSESSFQVSHVVSGIVKSTPKIENIDQEKMINITPQGIIFDNLAFLYQENDNSWLEKKEKNMFHLNSPSLLKIEGDKIKYKKENYLFSSNIHIYIEFEGKIIGIPFSIEHIKNQDIKFNFI